MMAVRYGFAAEVREGSGLAVCLQQSRRREGAAPPLRESSVYKYRCDSGPGCIALYFARFDGADRVRFEGVPVIVGQLTLPAQAHLAQGDATGLGQVDSGVAPVQAAAPGGYSAGRLAIGEDLGRARTRIVEAGRPARGLGDAQVDTLEMEIIGAAGGAALDVDAVLAAAQ